MMMNTDQVHQEERRSGPIPLSRSGLSAGLQAMAQPLRDIAANGVAMGLELDVYEHLKPGIERLAHELENLA